MGDVLRATGRIFCTRDAVSGQYGGMNRVLMVIREQLAEVSNLTDQHLLDRFLTARDESAFAELVRRYGPLVWGACRRRLTNAQDAEDAFQATFLVLLRRVARLDGNSPLGPWLHKVAVMTARNVTRSSRRRAAVTGPMEREIPDPVTDLTAEQMDLDAALLALPERYRVPVVLCHLQGLSRREAAERLGCPEGTLSARLSRALQRLRARLGNGLPAVLAGAVIAVPATLASATVRSATVSSTSALTTAGLSPAVVGLTDGVLRMFWMKKMMTAAVVMVLVMGAGALAVGTAWRSADVAQATEPPAAGAPPAKAAPEETDSLKRVEKQLADLEKQKALLDAMITDAFKEKQKLLEAQREKEAAAAAAELGKDIAVDVAPGHSSGYTVREVVNGRVVEVACNNLDALTTYLMRAHNDPKGPKKLRISAFKNHPADDLRTVFAACKSAGYARAVFSWSEEPVYTLVKSPVTRHFVTFVEIVQTDQTDAPKPGEIDLKEYTEPKKP
jgi:RNA polymerase sigma factor (sigma-70 family)